MTDFEGIQPEGLPSSAAPEIVAPPDLFGRSSLIPSLLSPPVVRLDDTGALDPLTIPLSEPFSEISSLSLTGEEATVGISSDDSLLSAMSIATALSDLVVTSLTAPPVERSDANIFPVSWTITNQGTGATTSDYWIDGFYLSTDAVFNPNTDTQLTGYYRQKSLGAGESYTNTSLTVYQYSPVLGNYYLFLAVDTWREGLNNLQLESDETNNVSAPVPITILPPSNADLVVSTVSVTGNPTAGGLVTISWTVQNQGTETADEDWYDYIYLSRDEVYDYQDRYLTTSYINSKTPLGVGKDYSITQSIYLPTDISNLEDYYLLVFADVGNTQSEFNNNNNTKAIPLISRD
jgi:large repetitive protein